MGAFYRIAPRENSFSPAEQRKPLLSLADDG
jgi:hypothetical protein